MAKGIPPKETQFKPGQTGNPNGRPRKLPQLDKLMAELMGSESEDGTESEMALIIKAQIKKAKAGDTRAAEYLSDRGYGKTKNHIDLTSGGKPLDNRHEIIFKDFSKDAKP